MNSFTSNSQLLLKKKDLIYYSIIFYCNVALNVMCQKFLFYIPLESKYQ